MKTHESKCSYQRKTSWRVGQLLLHHNKAPSNTSDVAKATTAKAGLELVEHPLHSTDLTHTDYHLKNTFMENKFVRQPFFQKELDIYGIKNYGKIFEILLL